MMNASRPPSEALHTSLGAAMSATACGALLALQMRARARAPASEGAQARVRVRVRVRWWYHGESARSGRVFAVDALGGTLDLKRVWQQLGSVADLERFVARIFVADAATGGDGVSTDDHGGGWEELNAQSDCRPLQSLGLRSGRLDVVLEDRTVARLQVTDRQRPPQSQFRLQRNGYFGIGIVRGKVAANEGTLWRSAYQLGAAYTFTVDKQYRDGATSSGRTSRPGIADAATSSNSGADSGNGGNSSHASADLTDTYCSWEELPALSFDSFAAFAAARPRGATLVGVEIGKTSVPLESFEHPPQACYVLGSESHGLPKHVAAACRFVVQLPAVRAASFNVAVAASIVMYDRLYKQQMPRPRAPLSQPQLQAPAPQQKQGQAQRQGQGQGRASAVSVPGPAVALQLVDRQFRERVLVYFAQHISGACARVNTQEVQSRGVNAVAHERATIAQAHTGTQHKTKSKKAKGITAAPPPLLLLECDSIHDASRLADAVLADAVLARAVQQCYAVQCRQRVRGTRGMLENAAEMLAAGVTTWYDDASGQPDTGHARRRVLRMRVSPPALRAVLTSALPERLSLSPTQNTHILHAVLINSNDGDCDRHRGDASNGSDGPALGNNAVGDDSPQGVERGAEVLWGITPVAALPGASARSSPLDRLQEILARDVGLRSTMTAAREHVVLEVVQSSEVPPSAFFAGAEWLRSGGQLVRAAGCKRGVVDSLSSTEGLIAGPKPGGTSQYGAAACVPLDSETTAEELRHALGINQAGDDGLGAAARSRRGGIAAASFDVALGAERAARIAARAVVPLMEDGGVLVLHAKAFFAPQSQGTTKKQRKERQRGRRYGAAGNRPGTSADTVQGDEAGDGCKLDSFDVARKILCDAVACDIGDVREYHLFAGGVKERAMVCTINTAAVGKRR
eukprot:g2351.t1